MIDFKKLEEDYQQTQVTLDVNGLTGSGVLSLAGNDTELRIVTPHLSDFGADVNGWFNLRLKSSRPADIFLHNAIRMRAKFDNEDRQKTESVIFPNFVAFGAIHLTDDGKMTSITFTLKGLRDFFYYEAIEWQNLYNITPDIRKALQKIRKLKKKNSRNFEFFRPDSYFLIHRLPSVLKFRVEDRSYQISMGVTMTHSYTNPSVEIYPLATITFDYPQSLEEGVNHAWDWRLFFSQMAMDRLPFQSISARARGRPRGEALLYLPGLNETPPLSHAYSFNPGRAPFHRWKDRRLLAATMKGWLEKQPGRRVFRANLDRVIDEMNERTSPDHILTLTAGIESLAELDTASPYAKKDIKLLADAAAAAAKDAKIDVSAERISALLGMLLKQNLPGRVRRLGDAITSQISQDYTIVIPAIQRIRNARAHGSADFERSIIKLSATTCALAAICVLWDHKTSGMPFDKLQNQLNPQVMANDALRHIAQVTSG